MVRVKLVPGDGFSEADRGQLARGLEERLGPGMRIVIEEVADIPSERSGKFRWVISNVDHSTHVDWGKSEGGP